MTPHIYLKRSTDEEAGEAQSDECRNWLFRNTYAAPRVWSDTAGVQQRDQLIDAAEGGKVQLVVVWSLEHLGRDLAESARIVARLRSAGVMLVSVHDGLDLRGRDAVSMGQINAVAAFTALPRVERAETGLNAPERLYPGLSEAQDEMIRRHWMEHGRANPGVLARSVGITPLHAGRILAKLTKEGAILGMLKAQGGAGAALAAVFEGREGA